MSKITIHPIDSVYIGIETDEESIIRELADKFTFFVPNYKFLPLYKKGVWDGKIRLLNLRKRTLYKGLIYQIQNFCELNNYEFESKLEEYEVPISEYEIKEFFSELNLPDDLTPRDYQIETVAHCIRKQRATILSATGCHSENDKIIKSNGEIEFVKNLKVGDKIIEGDGKSKEILKLFSGEDDLYEIDFINGNESIKVTKNHILKLKNTFGSKVGKKQIKNGKEYITLSEKYKENEEILIYVDDYLKKDNEFKRRFKVVFNDKPLSFEDEYIWDLKISPYFFGLYLGDGSANSCQITTMDSEIVEEIYRQANELNMVVNVFDKIIKTKSSPLYNTKSLAKHYNIRNKILIENSKDASGDARNLIFKEMEIIS